MSTPMSAYCEAAVRWGAVDRHDQLAVANFFTHRFPCLPQETQAEIRAFLATQEGLPEEEFPRHRRPRATGDVEVEVAEASPTPKASTRDLETTRRERPPTSK